MHSMFNVCVTLLPYSVDAAIAPVRQHVLVLVAVTVVKNIKSHSASKGSVAVVACLQAVAAIMLCDSVFCQGDHSHRFLCDSAGSCHPKEPPITREHVQSVPQLQP